MFFAIRDLELRKIPFEVELPPGQIDFLNPELKQSGNLHATGQVELLSSTLGEVRIHGHLLVTVLSPCDRCLESASVVIDSDFDL